MPKLLFKEGSEVSIGSKFIDIDYLCPTILGFSTQNMVADTFLCCKYRSKYGMGEQLLIRRVFWSS